MLVKVHFIRQPTAIYTCYGPSGKAEQHSLPLNSYCISYHAAYDPIRALQSFRDNKSSLLLVTAAAARGLDLPAVSHVYSLGPPTDATNYLHRAGRAGRIGSTSGEQGHELTSVPRAMCHVG